MSVKSPDRETIIQQLHLEPHVEGGYFRRTYESGQRINIKHQSGERPTMTSIYYMLTADSAVGYWHLNRSDIVHYYHLGNPVQYFMIHPGGALETAVVGPDLSAGQQLQLTVPGGTWKASHLSGGDYGLVSEAVSPGFDYRDMNLGRLDALLESFPQHAELVRAFSRGPESP